MYAAVDEHVGKYGHTSEPQISGVSTHGRCWHRGTDCPRYRATTNRPVTVGPVVRMTAGEAKALGYGLCSGCLKLLTSA